MGRESDESRGRRRAPILHRTCPQCGGKVPVDRKRCPDCDVNLVVARQNRDAALEGESDGFGPERAALSKGVAGGILLVVIAVVWFVVGWEAGYIFYYPPILAVIGIYGIVKGLADGNLTGRAPPSRRRRSVRSRPAAAVASERAPLPELTAASKSERREQRAEARRRGRRRMTFIVAGAAVLAVGLAGLLGYLAEREARDARERLAARLQAEHELLVGAREPLAARVQLLEELEHVIGRSDLRPRRAPVKPAPRHGGSAEPNILFVWLAREGVEPPGIPDDRRLVERLAAQADRTLPPEEPWGASLEAELRQALSRHVAVAEVLGHKPTSTLTVTEKLRAIRSRNLAALNSFEGGTWHVAIHLIDSRTGEVVASDDFDVESSEEIEVEMTFDPYDPLAGDGVDIERAAAIDLDRRLAEALAWRLERMAGGTWSFEVASK